MTPHQIEILLHHYASPSKWPTPSVAYNQDVEWFMTNDVLEESFQRETPVVTNKGRAWVAALMAVECPTLRSVWIDQHGQVMEFPA